MEKNKIKMWYKNGRFHRDDGPAIIYPNGTKEWYQKGVLHRTDGPAIEWSDGTKEWFRNGQLHRTDGPAIECANGTKEWFENNRRHRTDGPAIENAITRIKYWYRNGEYIKSCFPKTVPYVKNKDTEDEEEMEIELCCKECAKLYHNIPEEISEELIRVANDPNP